MSSVENEDQTDCSNASSRNGDISNPDYSKKFEKKNINIRNFKIMLVNGLSKANVKADPPPEPKEEDQVSDVSNAALVDKVVLTNNKVVSNNDTISADVIQVGDSDLVGDEFDDKSSIDEKSFELRIDNDDDEDDNIVVRSYLNADLQNKEGSDFRGKNKIIDEPSLNAAGSGKVRRRTYSSTDLENISIPTDDDEKSEKLITASPAASSEASSNLIQSPDVKFNCAFCEKTWPTRHSLKFHVLSHLKFFLKQETKNPHAPTFEIDPVTAQNIDSRPFLDFMCALCDRTFANNVALRMHYKVDHAQKGSPQNPNRLQPPASVVERRQSGEKIENAVQIITANESSTSLTADESNEDASKQYKCYICDKQFARHSSLQWHIQFHETHMFSKLKKNNSELENGLTPAASTSVESPLPDSDHPFRCQVCGKTYESLPGYRKHMVNHRNVDDENPGVGEKCELCNKYCPTAVGLKRHIIFMHKDQLPPPAVEDMEDVGVEDGVDSVSGSSVSDEYVCNICGRPFTHRNSYKRHLNLVHKMSPDEVPSREHTPGVRCDSCGRYFTTSSNMRKHARMHCKKTLADGDEDEFVCDICQRSFCSQRALSIHRAHGHRGDVSDSVPSDTEAGDSMTNDMIPCDSYIEKDEGGFQCTVCDKTFESRKGVVRHIGYHRSALSAQIALNNTGADDNDDFEDEDDEDEAEPGDRIPCEVCDKTFASIRGMRIHLNSHKEDSSNDEESDDNDSETGFDCHICNETFTGYRSFKMHLSWHTRRGEEAVVPRRKSAKMPFTPPEGGASKIHQCQYCPRWYSTQQGLAGHMKAHQPQKGTPPARSDPLQTPSTGGKTSKSSMCKVCGQHFPNGASLSSHMKSHIDEDAGRPTTSSGQLLTLEDTMECDMCGKYFMRKQDMAKHMRDHMSGAVTKENVDLSLFRCIYCQKSFVGRKSLNTHQILHEEAQVALKRAANELLVEGPPAKQHKPNNSAAQDDLIGWDDMMPAHQCEECGRRLSTKQSLRRHMEWHAKVRGIDGYVGPSLKERNSMGASQSLAPAKESEGISFECLYCRKSFNSKNALVEHTKIHENPPAGGAEDVVVNDLEELGEHAVVQCVEGGNEEYFVFEERDGVAFQCSECDETHSDKLQMIVHMAFHVGQRWTDGRQKALIIKVDPIMLAPFECMFCSERFVNKTFRTKHVLQRHGDDVFQCNSCKKIFLSKKKLAIHCRQHFVDSMYRCERCLKCFTSKWFLKRHARKKCAGKSSPEEKQELEFSMSNMEFSAIDA